MWNVKHAISLQRIKHELVLIETLWNVKVGSWTRGRSSRRGFNRNIVECKEVSAIINLIAVVRFNRNIVECKEAPQAGRGAGRSVLIETLWNVNNGDPDAGNALRVGFNRNIMECKGRIYQCA